ncbi:hypothetical protein HN827_02845 [archaeon]|jgi:hypothetical protein|nr:hypothetical protein [archaeon]MBT4647182.1 hypothetical protein [archaeon]MBT6822185.1 hypothetical protein [archaeon]MBT7391740.1 hypothetical protein [archaeon]
MKIHFSVFLLLTLLIFSNCSVPESNLENNQITSRATNILYKIIFAESIWGTENEDNIRGITIVILNRAHSTEFSDKQKSLSENIENNILRKNQFTPVNYNDYPYDLNLKHHLVHNWFKENNEIDSKTFLERVELQIKAICSQTYPDNEDYIQNCIDSGYGGRRSYAEKTKKIVDEIINKYILQNKKNILELGEYCYFASNNANPCGNLGITNKKGFSNNDLHTKMMICGKPCNLNIDYSQNQNNLNSIVGSTNKNSKEITPPTATPTQTSETVQEGWNEASLSTTFVPDYCGFPNDNKNSGKFIPNCRIFQEFDVTYYCCHGSLHINKKPECNCP